MSNIFIIAGDSSGDIYAADLIQRMKAKNDIISFEGIAGDAALKEGMKLWVHSKNLNFMGFWEVFKNYKILRKTWKKITQHLNRKKPDLLVLIDYPGLNLLVAKYAKKYNIRIVYYIPPQVWFWKQGRIKKLRKYTDYIAPIYPHESSFFENKGVPHFPVKHISLDKIFIEQLSEVSKDKKINILCMPGSRKLEIDNNFPEMLSAVINLQERHNLKNNLEVFVIKAQTSSNLEEIIDLYKKDIKKINIIPFDQKELAFKKAHVGCISSGTACLEVALAGIPLVVIYKANLLFKILLKYVYQVKFKWISLPNLIAQKDIIQEIKETSFSENAISNALSKLIFDAKHRKQSYTSLLEMRSTLEKTAKYNIDDLITLALNKDKLQKL
ncbi:MAG: lipid-A-disaccharide synthase [Legionellales bacterium]|mgnify:CR=1 FL=1|nr:lipid-A-disaccharide synthase [Legionellales bacterium]OUX65192.1 MAG: lipid-A-disaccharide synthase [Gammaproteobacteria bacterium TMED281]